MSVDVVAADPMDAGAVSGDGASAQGEAGAGTASAAAAGADEPLVLGRYQLGERIAAGAAGSVIAARDVRSDRQVVVKFFDASDDSYGPWADEMRLAMRLRHPNIVPCLNTGYDPTHRMWALVFERQQGGSLRRGLLERRPFNRLGVLRDGERVVVNATLVDERRDARLARA